MKPILFQTSTDLTLFINSMPEVPGQTVKGTSGDIKIALLRLVPAMFDLKDVLVGSAGGVGNNKSLYRFADVASDKVSSAALEELDAALTAIDAETEILLQMGLSEESVAEVGSARKKVSHFQMAAKSIEGFKNKLKTIADRVEAKDQDMQASLVKNGRVLKKTLGEEKYQELVREYSKKVENLKKLSADLDEYCHLNLAYLGLVI